MSPTEITTRALQLNWLIIKDLAWIEKSHVDFCLEFEALKSASPPEYSNEPL